MILIAHVKSQDAYADLLRDAETRFDAVIYNVDKPLPLGKNK